MRIALPFVLALAACGGGDGPPHWNKQPLESFEGTQEGVAYTIQLPKGMRQSPVDSKYSVEYGYHARVGDEDYVFAPSISVSTRPKETLEDAIKGERSVKAPTDVVFQEATATGWVFAIENDSYKGKDDFLIRGQTFLGDKALYCSARLYPMRKGQKAKADIPLVAKMCQSLKAK